MSTLADIREDSAPGTAVAVVIETVGARAARRDERYLSPGIVHDEDGYAWPNAWHYRPGVHGGQDGSDIFRIFDGDCPVRSVEYADVVSHPLGGGDPRLAAAVFEAWDGHCITQGDRSGRNGAWRRALLHTRDMCVG